MLGNGLGIWDVALLGGAGGSPQVPDAPTLVWTSGATDNTPNFAVDLPSGLGAPHDAITGDLIYLEVSDNISFTSTSTDALDAGDVAGDIVAMEESMVLADGTYYARARLKRGPWWGPYSNVVTVTIDTIPVTPPNARIISTGNYRIVSTGNYRKTA